MDPKDDPSDVPSLWQYEEVDAWLEGYNTAVREANVIIEDLRKQISDRNWRDYPEAMGR